MSANAFAVRMPPDVRSVQVGGHAVVFIDDFLADPQALADAACRARFEPCAGFDEKRGYPGLRAPVPPAYSECLTALLDPLIRINFGVPDALALKKTPCAFSLTTVAPGDLGPLQRVPHFDASTPHYMAALLYLCDEQQGGTAFYRHRATGLQQITADGRERYGDAVYAELDRQPAPARYFADSDARFELLGVMRARFNRLVVYRGSLLHSAIVNPRRLSADPRAGRLTVNSFYDF
ncbi:DUF6445 family protein [Pelomonas aquatica]|jgi:hypothetical protein|uniref:DUF6445 family protein n=1 Tax=Pelomonas aquatica TaxID=431058 RepID=UPI00227C5E49|nr:DUF6445 family protein [Pelomonas aquatica]MCY4757261.1 DUF6445 family protein [Pelomonas aquatica]